MKHTKKSKGININDFVANVDKGHKWKGNILQMLAEEMVRHAVPMEDVIKIDLSEKLLKEIDREIKNEEISSIQINAKPRMAKSTLAILLMYFEDAVLKKYGYKSKDIEIGMQNIARDQTEKSKIMRKPDLMYDVIMTDESNALEDTGENATVEKAQRDVFSDVQAGRYIHGIWVCPEGTMDKNTDIKLEIRNKDKGLIHTRVYYFMKSSYYYGWVLIGIADFDVSKLIKNWMKVKDRFLRYIKERSNKDKKYIEYWCKRDFYILYMYKKYEKMELMNREGIMHARDLDYAHIRKEVVDALKPLAMLTMISMQRLRNNIKIEVEAAYKRRKMPMSMLGREMEYERVCGILDLYRSSVEIRESINRLRNKLKSGKLEVEEYNKVMTVLKQAEERLDTQIKNKEEDLDKLVQLNLKYNSHLE